jgi:hypothetical protein
MQRCSSQQEQEQKQQQHAASAASCGGVGMRRALLGARQRGVHVCAKARWLVAEI